ncbi:FAD:protein FMN transferase [Pararhodobacter sp.]|uniref:FAD:protein FMN transferase n=1 Tax=Pararhodobacter sp. TaxID=2127056 RepID=UPI002AFDE387|nr:FAD:protein FMN transferase [Pararhodobacter sp.]
MSLSRRRFIAISAAFAAATPAKATAIHQWRGVALGADASITLAHADAEAIVARALREISRLEAIFSLHDPNSALVRLNTAGRLDHPPFELLECLSTAGAVHAASGGRFDPTIQPLWALYAEHISAGQMPDAASLATVMGRIGWSRLRIDAAAIEMQPGMALSLNGIAQGYIADKVAALLRAEGLHDVLINTGEFVALGGHPQGGDWPVSLSDGQTVTPDAVHLRDGALASSSPHAITFDASGTVSHILDPQTGAPAPAHWRLITVTAPTAALADALSTACCLMDQDAITATLAAFPRASLAFAS